MNQMSEVITPLRAQYVIDKMNEFVAGESWTRAYSFAHIVLGDQNLGEGHIKFCLQPHIVNDWTSSQLKDRALNPVRNENRAWELHEYDQVISERDSIIAFLRWLLSLTDELRDEVSELYRQQELTPHSF